MKKRIAVAALGCPNEVGFAWATQQRAQTAALLKDKGLDVVEIETILQSCECADRVASEIRDAAVEAVVICVITWSEDNYVLQLLRSVNVPLVLHSFPHMESGSLFCSCCNFRACCDFVPIPVFASDLLISRCIRFGFCFGSFTTVATAGLNCKA